MFEQMKDSYIEMADRQLVHLYRSLNEPAISMTAGSQATPARGYMMVFKAQKKIQIFVGLYFPQTKERMLFESKAFPAEQLHDNLSQGETFLSDMGFLVDNTHFFSANSDQKNEMMRTLPFLYREMDLYLQALTSSEMQASSRKVEAAQSRDRHVELQRTFLEQYLTLISML